MKPMLACVVEDLKDLKFPGYVSPKLDGIRALVIEGVVVSRKLLPIPNKHVQKLFGRPEYEGFDGELTLRDSKNFNAVQSAVMTEDGEPEVIYQVFDDHRRCFNLELLIEEFRNLLTVDFSTDRVVRVSQTRVRHLGELMKWHKRFVAWGFEGTIFRTADSPYKFGRSTPKEQYLVKIKDFKDDEAVVVGAVQKVKNDNPPTQDELGNTKRSSHKKNKTPLEMLGALSVKYKGHQLSIGSGFTDAQRSSLWYNKDSLNGLIVKFKYQEVSEYGVPRFPVFLGFRDKRDL